jgi:four helix bundle protein
VSVFEDFDHHLAYRAAAELVDFIYQLEDRFPEDELLLLFMRLREAAAEVGARIAQGFGRDGLDADGGLSEATVRQAKGELCRLRHYVLTSQQRFFVDERQMREFDELYDKITAALARPARA